MPARAAQGCRAGPPCTPGDGGQIGDGVRLVCGPMGTEAPPPPYRGRLTGSPRCVGAAAPDTSPMADYREGEPGRETSGLPFHQTGSTP